MKNKTNTIAWCLNFVTGFKNPVTNGTNWQEEWKIMVFLCISSDFLNFVTDFSWGTNWHKWEDEFVWKFHIVWVCSQAKRVTRAARCSVQSSHQVAPFSEKTEYQLIDKVSLTDIFQT